MYLLETCAGRTVVLYKYYMYTLKEGNALDKSDPIYCRFVAKPERLNGKIHKKRGIFMQISEEIAQPLAQEAEANLWS